MLYRFFHKDSGIKEIKDEFFLKKNNRFFVIGW